MRDRSLQLMMCPGRGLWEIESGVSGKGYRMGCPLAQWFSTTFLEDPNTAHFTCLLNQAHMIQVTYSLVETHRLEMGVSDKGDMQNVQCWGSFRNVVENPTALAKLVGTPARD